MPIKLSDSMNQTQLLAGRYAFKQDMIINYMSKIIHVNDYLILANTKKLIVRIKMDKVLVVLLNCKPLKSHFTFLSAFGGTYTGLWSIFSNATKVYEIILFCSKSS